MIPFHPLADIFPLIEGEEFAALVADMKANGFRQDEKIHILDDQILDGRNRYRAALAAGLLSEDDGPDRRLFFVKFMPELDGDPVRFVISKNLNRRHLSPSQRGMIAADLGKLSWGGDRSKPSTEGLPVEQRAEIAQVGHATVERADIVKERGVAELQDAVRQGEVSVNAAVAIAARPEPEQADIVAKGRAEILRAAKQFRAEDQAHKRERRAAREAELAAKQTALPDKRYGVILADPEWRFAPWSRDTGMDRAADNHYPTSVTEVIAARPVGAIAAKDCALFLWATAPMLPHALAVMQAWGFDYRTHFVWAKDRTGTGYWNRNRHELLLLGIRGNVPAPAMGEQWDSLLPAAVGAHSEKPERFHVLIERYFPNLPKIELNARRARPGWDCWGLEAPETVDPETGEILDNSESLAKADVEEAGLQHGLPVLESVSRPADGRSSAATSEIMDVTAGETAPLDLPNFLKRNAANVPGFARGVAP